MAPNIELRLPATPDAAAHARVALGELEAELGLALLKDLRLMVSELVTNSIRHVGSGQLDTIELRAWRYENRFKIEVSDGGPGFEPVVTAGRGDEVGGWGLYIVESLSDRWGAERRGNRAVVWFEIDMRPENVAAVAPERQRSLGSQLHRGEPSANAAA
jgi:anti-sigma regulatory factor (Ser/Thr protein kinase)